MNTPLNVIKAMEEVRDSGVVNMMDANSVVKVLSDDNQFEAVEYLIDGERMKVDRNKYSQALKDLGEYRKGEMK